MQKQAPIWSRSSFWVLVAANLVPIAGAVFWDWAVKDIVLLYWLENLVIGAFNVARILAAQPGKDENADAREQLYSAKGKAALSGFFLLHYGGFWAVHGLFLFSMLPGARAAGSGTLEALAAVLREEGMLVALLAIVASHGYSFLRNYIGRREYKGVDVALFLMQPYKRVFVTHLFIIVGAFALAAHSLPAAALVIFIAVKIGADAYFHDAEHQRLEPAMSGRS